MSKTALASSSTATPATTEQATPNPLKRRRGVAGPSTESPLPVAASEVTRRKRARISKLDGDSAGRPPSALPDGGSAFHRPSDIDDAMPTSIPISRPADPPTTNAPLKTSEGFQLTTKPTLSQPLTSTATTTILEEAKAHLLRADPRLRPLIERHHCPVFSPSGLAEVVDPFRSLCTGIMGQQVSAAAATAIKKRFIMLFNPNDNDTSSSGPNPVPGSGTPPSPQQQTPTIDFPTPAQVAARTPQDLRAAGLSGRKAEYIHGLAQEFASGALTASQLLEATDEQLLPRLTAIRGLGRWSAEMFACFGLKRLDVLSTGDLGIQRGMAAYVKRDARILKGKGDAVGKGKWKYMSEADMLRYSAPFAPYRSLFMWYMWRIEDADIEALRGG